MAATYEPIATTNGTGSSGTITFSSIPGTYTDLVLVCSIIGDANAAVRVRLNGDTTSSNYSYILLYGSGSTAGSTNNTATQIYIGHANTTTPNASITSLNNYSNSTTYKTLLNRGNQVNQFVSGVVGLWRNTAAITSVTVAMDSGNYTTGTTMTLYGIKSA